MEIISNYAEMLGHYQSKLNSAQEDWSFVTKEMQAISALIGEGWYGRAGEEAELKLDELRKAAGRPTGEMEDVRAALASLGLAIEEELRRLAEEEAKAEEAMAIEVALQADAMENSI